MAVSRITFATAFKVTEAQMGDWSGSPVWTPGSSQDTWWVPHALDDCAANPPIQSYHVHVFFRSNNRSSIALAQRRHKEFVEAMNPDMELCPHPHMDGASSYPEICQFPASLDTASMATASGGFFALPNYAFFIPRIHHEEAEAWWRQHHMSLDYIVHTNTGCQDPDHTLWPTVSAWSGWSPRLVDKSGLICCHTGPAGCRCDITLYRDSQGRALVSQGLGKAIVVQEVSGRLGAASAAIAVNADIGSKGWASAIVQSNTDAGTRFRETVYDPRGDARGFSQIEDFGDQNLNTYECLAIKDGNCVDGAQVMLEKCSYGDEMGTRFSWVDDAASEGPGFRQRSGHLASDSCPGLCLTAAFNSTAVTLASCRRVAAWTRFGTGNKDAPTGSII
jgi:aromatic ring-cleaving dioxygenase